MRLGYCYSNGIGTEVNKEKACELYNIAADKGDSRVAQNNLGYLYINENNLEKAIYWLQKAIENEDEVAYDNLGICYELGIGINKDKIKAFELYKKSSEKGYTNAKFYLGYCYVNGIGTKINKEKGFELYDEASKEKNSDDLNKVKYWYQKSAEHNNKAALYELGKIYELGKGVNKNVIRAFDFYNQSAEKGCINGKCKLGYYFLYGIIVDTDKKRAFDLYKESAEGEVVEAQKNLALLYEQGEGVEKNINSAIYWYKKCIDNGCLEVKERLDNLLNQQEI